MISPEFIKDFLKVAKHRIDAQSLIDSLGDFPFPDSFSVLFLKFLSMLNALSKSFQSETQDLAYADGFKNFNKEGDASICWNVTKVLGC
jgi:hypothetical protein